MLLEALDLEIFLQSVKNMEITSKNTTINTTQIALIHIMEDLASLLDLCTGDTVDTVLPIVFSLATSMSFSFPPFLPHDDSCLTLLILLEGERCSTFLEVLSIVPSWGQFLPSWCKYRALFKALPHSMLSRSLSRVSRSSFIMVVGSGASGNLAHQVFTTSAFLQSALSKLQLPTPNLSPIENLVFCSR